LVAKLQNEIERERQATKDLAMYKRRLDEATKDNLKLERALEEKVRTCSACTHSEEYAFRRMSHESSTGMSYEVSTAMSTCRGG